MGENDGERWKDLIEERIKGLEASVDSLVAWRSWILGIVAGIGLVIGAFAKQIGIVMGQFFK